MTDRKNPRSKHDTTPLQDALYVLTVLTVTVLPVLACTAAMLLALTGYW